MRSFRAAELFDAVVTGGPPVPFCAITPAFETEQSGPPADQQIRKQTCDTQDLEGQILVVVEGEVLGAVCVEPAIRALAEKGGQGCRITICHEHADLLAGHPAVHCVAYDELDIYLSQFKKIFRLKAGDPGLSLKEQVLNYLEQLNLTTEELKPKIHLAGFDMLRAQRFGMSSLKKPRIALAVSSSLSEGDVRIWNEIYKALREKYPGGYILLSDEKVQFDIEKNLSGKLMSREAAAVLSQCDLLITTELSYAALAGAAGTAAVLASAISTAGREEFGGIAQARQLDAESVFSAIEQLNEQA